MIPENDLGSSYKPPLPAFAVEAFRKEKIMLTYQNAKKFLQSQPEEEMKLDRLTPPPPSSLKISRLWRSDKNILKSLSTREGSLDNIIQKRRSYESRAKILLSRLEGYDERDAAIREVVDGLKKFDQENKTKILELEAALGKVNKDIATRSPSSGSPHSEASVESASRSTDSPSIRTSSPEEGSMVEFEEILLRDPPENPYTKEKIISILKGEGGIHQDTRDIVIGGGMETKTITVLDSLVMDGERNLCIFYEKEGEGLIEINDPNKELDEVQDLEKVVEGNIVRLYDCVGQERMAKIALLLSHGSDALIVKSILGIHIAHNYPELDVDPKRLRGEGRRIVKILETERDVIVEKEILFELQEAVSENDDSERDVKSCYLNTISRTILPKEELDRRDFLSTKSSESKIESFVTFYRPCLTKEAAVACSDLHKLLD